MEKTLIISYFISINILAFALCVVDKFKAVRQCYRIPEKTLLWVSFIGGATGLFIAMYMVHHKTKKNKFRISVPLFMVIHIFIIAKLYQLQ